MGQRFAFYRFLSQDSQCCLYADDKLELFLTILNNLKDGLIENLKISDEPVVDTVSEDEQEFYEIQKCDLQNLKRMI